MTIEGDVDILLQFIALSLASFVAELIWTDHYESFLVL